CSTPPATRATPSSTTAFSIAAPSFCPSRSPSRTLPPRFAASSTNEHDHPTRTAQAHFLRLSARGLKGGHAAPARRGRCTVFPLRPRHTAGLWRLPQGAGG